MSYVEMTEIASGVRELTDTELAMVAGGGKGPWGDLVKLGAALAGRAVIGGTLGGAIGALAAIVGIEAYKSCDSSAGDPGLYTPIPIGDAAL